VGPVIIITGGGLLPIILALRSVVCLSEIKLQTATPGRNSRLTRVFGDNSVPGLHFPPTKAKTTHPPIKGDQVGGLALRSRLALWAIPMGNSAQDIDALSQPGLPNTTRKPEMPFVGMRA